MISDVDDMDIDRVPDTLDRAAMEARIQTEESIRRVLRHTEKAPHDFDGHTCIDCGEEIQPERLATGAFRDIYCQVVHETKSKHMRRD